MKHWCWILLFFVACEVKDRNIDFKTLEKDLGALALEEDLNQTALATLRKVENDTLKRALSKLTYAQYGEAQPGLAILKAERNEINRKVDSATIAFEIAKKQRFKELSHFELEEPYQDRKYSRIPYTCTFEQDSIWQFYDLLEIRFYMDDRFFVHTMVGLDTVAFGKEYPMRFFKYFANEQEAKADWKQLKQIIAEGSYRLDFRPGGNRSKSQPVRDAFEHRIADLLEQRKKIDQQLNENLLFNLK
ncbi:hypothetical protein [Persicobacter diffluens]|uniref:Uncharacterized protein n=1 Tax=Persicobacter diffluens TaxID=981 RepID=A0AAN4VYW7_9BACT|nr:hypothetical protein PEDI_28550 [Persicobacter diffluens]